MKKNFVFAVALLALSACTFYSVESQNVVLDYPPKQSANDVQYLEEVSDLHEVIGTVTVTTERNQKLEDIIPRMKREAAIIGADAITDIKTDATGQWKKLPAQKLVGNAYIRANFSAKAIVFKK
jgi:hypothetical protein